MAVAYLQAAYGDVLPDAAVLRRHEVPGGAAWPVIAAMARRGVNAPLTSSAGRLFDAMAALLGVRDDVNYEGQAAIELEQRADPQEASSYPMGINSDLVLAGADLICAGAEDLARGVPTSVIAARFHNGLADATARVCSLIRERTGLATVACSGGVFQNLLLLERVTTALERDGFRVLTHSRVPPNDGGISLGQAAVAAAQARAAL
jgi:hydrogenase maturation protein HypF